MFTLSAHHLEEISTTPELMSLVDGATLQNADTDTFLRLCVVHHCVDTFRALLPNTNYVTGPLTLLAGLNAVKMAQCMDISLDCPHKWIRAARRAAKAGHLDFVKYILTQMDNDEVRKAAANGACIGDHVEILKILLPTIKDQNCLNHLPVLAAQHNSMACMPILLESVSARVWASTLLAAVFQERPIISDMILENIPSNLEVEKEWAIKVAVRGLSGNLQDPQNLLRFLFQHITIDDVRKVRPQLPPDLQEHMITAHQYVMLSNQTADVQAMVSKRKM